jgi:RNA processing factor Prp31
VKKIERLEDKAIEKIRKQKGKRRFYCDYAVQYHDKINELVDAINKISQEPFHIVLDEPPIEGRIKKMAKTVIGKPISGTDIDNADKKWKEQFKKRWKQFKGRLKADCRKGMGYENKTD